ncbi:hypothetical protein [Caldivirga sp.]|uniref:hypothetical protein n=1 Tax=Caldivirga sp. TaxID=2080243 RepID=UPI0025C708F3|nr:hypothetical protein [Caldivirga sp.]
MMICLDYYGLCIALLGSSLNMIYGYLLMSWGNAIMRRIGESHIFDTLLGFSMYVAVLLMLINQKYLLNTILNSLNLRIEFISQNVKTLQCSVTSYGTCVMVNETIKKPIIDPGAASLAFGSMANALVNSLTQLYIAEVTLTVLPFISPVGYYLNDISRYFTWQAEWALVNTYMLYYLSMIANYAMQLTALGASLIPIRQVRWIGGFLFSIGLVTPIYVVTVANWLVSQGLAVSINPSLINDVKGIISLGTNLFSLGSRLEEFNVVIDVSIAIYSSILYGLSKLLGEVGLLIDI